MDLEQIRKYCLSLPHATERVQWGNDLLFCIGEKMSESHFKNAYQLVHDKLPLRVRKKPGNA